MELWLAAILLIIFSSLFLSLILCFSHKNKKPPIMGLVFLGVIMLTLISYIGLTLLFVLF